MKTVLLLVTILSVCAVPNESYRILCLFPYNGKSHFQLFGALCRGLAGKGHQVDVISHYPSKSPPANYTDVVSLAGTLESAVNSFTADVAAGPLNENIVYTITSTYGIDLCHLMGHEGMQAFIKNPPKYDAIVTEYFASPCFLGLGHYLNAPVITVSAPTEMPNLDERIGNPLSSAFYPGGYLTHKAVLKTFWDRLENAVMNFVYARAFNYYISAQTDVMRKYLGEDMPDIVEVEKNIALLLVNTHRSFHGPRPLAPALIEIAGLHCEQDQSKLTPELKEWLDKATAGVVYFTLGSYVSIDTLPQEKLLSIYNSFRKISPIKVLMRIADKGRLPPGLPDNVMTMPWIPQIPVLRHKNTKVFITHGGLLGSLEAIYYGVPTIGIPLFVDQRRNVNTYIIKRIGVALEYDTISEQAIDEALQTVLNDPSYRANMKRESALFKDRPMSAMDTAAFWIEYVIRNGPETIRSPAVRMPWWQTNLIDVYAFLLFCVGSVLYFVILVSRIVLRAIKSEKLEVNARHKKRN